MSIHESSAETLKLRKLVCVVEHAISDKISCKIKILVFTLYVNPSISNGVSHFNLLVELITTFGELFLVLFFIQISSEQQRRT